MVSQIMLNHVLVDNQNFDVQCIITYEILIVELKFLHI